MRFYSWDISVKLDFLVIEKTLCFNNFSQLFFFSPETWKNNKSELQPFFLLHGREIIKTKYYVRLTQWGVWLCWIKLAHKWTDMKTDIQGGLFYRLIRNSQETHLTLETFFISWFGLVSVLYCFYFIRNQRKCLTWKQSFSKFDKY